MFHEKTLETATRYPSIWDEMRAFSEALWGDGDLVRAFPRTDVIEYDDRYEMKLDLPGFKQRDVEIRIKDSVLTVASNHEEANEKQVNEEVKYLLRERRNVSFERSFRLPKDTKEDAIEASFTDGVLTINLPRKPELSRGPSPSRANLGVPLLQERLTDRLRRSRLSDKSHQDKIVKIYGNIASKVPGIGNRVPKYTSRPLAKPKNRQAARCRGESTFRKSSRPKQ